MNKKPKTKNPMTFKQIKTTSKESLIKELRDIADRKAKLKADKARLTGMLILISANLDLMKEKEIDQLIKTINNLDFVKQNR